MKDQNPPFSVSYRAGLFCGLFATLLCVLAQHLLLAAPYDQELVLQEGEHRIFPVTERVRVVVGNPRVLQVTHDERQTEIVVTAITSGFSSLKIGEESFAVTVHSATNLRSRWAAAQDLLRDVKGVEVLTRGDHLVLDGFVEDEASQARVGVVATTFQALNLVQMAPRKVLDKPLIRLTFRFAEVKRDWSTSIGIHWGNGVFTTVLRGVGVAAGNVPGALLLPEESEDLSSAGVSLSERLDIADLAGGTLDQLLSFESENSLYQIRDMHVITTLSGTQGQYLAGGSVMIPVSNALGQSSLEEKEFGVKLSVLPTLLEDDAVQLAISYEVSALLSSRDGSYTLSKRSQTTQVALQMGDVLVLASHLERPNARSVNGLPGLKNLPVLGPLFGSHAFQKGETEAAVFVTAERVEPTSTGDRDITQRLMAPVPPPSVWPIRGRRNRGVEWPSK